MTEFGPAMRGFVELAVAAEMTDDPLEATLLLKRLVKGVRLADLAPPPRRAETEALIGAVRTRAEADFAARNDRSGAPEVEVRRAMDAYERCVARDLADVLRELTPRETPKETVIAMVELTAAREEIFREDIVARDIGWAWVKSVLTAAHAYQAPLRELGLRPVG
ncbi:MAG: hypothetical protein PVI23_10390 [Maricaulaceae bacterium]|jgi:hypothetical protein